MNRLQRLWQFLKSNTGRLALTYLAIIMTMSIGFSVVLYAASARELGRQVPPPNSISRSFEQTTDFESGRPRTVTRFLQERVDEGRQHILERLIVLNIAALVGGSILSYLLARRTLRPIETAIQAQTQFISDASHELRTPLAAIMASNEVALRKKGLTLKDAKSVIGQNTHDVSRLTNLSDGLLSLASQDSQRILMTEISLQEVAGDALNQIIPAASAKKITVEDQVPDITVVAERTSLARALVILLDNAIKYSPEASTVAINAAKRGKYVYLKTIDQGIGIRASDVPHLFRRFYRADSARSRGDQPGYGLGLAIAEKIVTQHGGEITVESKLGHGSTFTIKLPLT